MQTVYLLTLTDNTLDRLTVSEEDGIYYVWLANATAGNMGMVRVPISLNKLENLADGLKNAILDIKNHDV